MDVAFIPEETCCFSKFSFSTIFYMNENTDFNINELNDIIGNLHPYCYEPEKDASESSASNED